MRSLSFLFILTACSQIPDVPVCRMRAANEGFCTYTISTEKDQIVNDSNMLNGKTWIDLKVESVMLPAESWAKIKEYIIKQCKKNNDCSSNIGTWQGKLDAVTP